MDTTDISLILGRLDQINNSLERIAAAIEAKNAVDEMTKDSVKELTGELEKTFNRYRR